MLFETFQKKSNELLAYQMLHVVSTFLGATTGSVQGVLLEIESITRPAHDFFLCQSRIGHSVGLVWFA